MTLKLFNARLLSLLHQRNALLALSFGLLILNGLQMGFSFTKDERVIVVPADLKQEVWMSRNRVSALIWKKWGFSLRT